MTAKRDDPVEVAINVIARHVIASGRDAVDWEDYPEIGENDWRRIVARVQALAPGTRR